MTAPTTQPTAPTAPPPPTMAEAESAKPTTPTTRKPAAKPAAAKKTAKNTASLTLPAAELKTALARVLCAANNAESSNLLWKGVKITALKGAAMLEYRGECISSHATIELPEITPGISLFTGHKTLQKIANVFGADSEYSLKITTPKKDTLEIAYATKGDEGAVFHGKYALNQLKYEHDGTPLYAAPTKNTPLAEFKFDRAQYLLSALKAILPAVKDKGDYYKNKAVYFIFSDGKIILKGTSGKMLAEWEMQPHEFAWTRKPKADFEASFAKLQIAGIAGTLDPEAPLTVIIGGATAETKKHEGGYDFASFQQESHGHEIIGAGDHPFSDTTNLFALPKPTRHGGILYADRDELLNAIEKSLIIHAGNAARRDEETGIVITLNPGKDATHTISATHGDGESGQINLPGRWEGEEATKVECNPLFLQRLLQEMHYPALRIVIAPETQKDMKTTIKIFPNDGDAETPPPEWKAAARAEIFPA